MSTTSTAIIRILSQTNVAGIKTTKEELDKLVKSVDAAGKATQAHAQRVTTTTTSMANGVKTISKQIEETNNAAAKSTKKATDNIIADWGRLGSQIGSSIRQLGQAMMNIGQTMSLFITAPLAFAGKQAIDAAGDWGQTGAALKAVTKDWEGGGEAVEDTGNQILDASKKFTFGANEMRFTQLMLKEAGFDLKTSLYAAVAGANLTTAAFDGAERTAEAYKTATMDLASATRLFGGNELQAAVNAGKWDAVQQMLIDNANTFAAVLNTSAARMGPFIEGFNYLAPVTSVLGWSLRDTATAIGMVSDKGIDGSRSGRELASAILQMANPSDETKTAMEQLGISLTDNKGNMKNFKDVVQELNAALFGVNPNIKANATSIDLMGEDVQGAEEKVRNLGVQIQNTNDQYLKQGRLLEDNGLMYERLMQAEMANLSQNKDRKGTPIAPRSAQEWEAYNKAFAMTTLRGDDFIKAYRDIGPLFDKLTPTMRDQIDTMFGNATAQDRAKDSVEKLNLQLKDAQAEYAKLTGDTKLMTDSQGRLTEAARLYYADLLFGNAGVRAMIPLVQSGTTGIDKYAESLKESGSAAEIAAKKTDNFPDKVAKLGVQIKNTMIKSFDVIIKKYLEPLVDWIGKAVAWFDGLDKAVQEQYITWGFWLAVAGPVIFLLGSLLFTIGMLTSAFFGFFSVILTAASNMRLLMFVGVPILGFFAILIGSILAVAGKFQELRSTIDGVKSPFESFIGDVKDAKEWFDDKIPTAIGVAKAAIDEFAKNFKGPSINLAGGIIGGVKDAFQGIMDFVGSLFIEKTIEVPVTARGGMAKGGPAFPGDDSIVRKTTELTGVGKQFIDTIAGIVSELAAKIGQVVEFLGQLGAIAQANLPLILAAFQTNLPPMVQKVGDAINAIVGPTGLIDAILKLAGQKDSLDEPSKKLGDALDIIGRAADAVKTAIEGINAAIREYQKLAEISSPFTTKLDILTGESKNKPKPLPGAQPGAFELGGTEDPTSPINILKGAWQALQEEMGRNPLTISPNGIIAAIPNIANAIKSITSNNQITEAVNSFKSIGSSLANKIGEGIADAVQSIIDAIVGAIGSVWAAAQSALDSLPPLTPPSGGGGGSEPEGKARGGRVSSGVPYWVGEEGPEPFIPNTSGTIIPNGLAMAMLGNVGMPSPVPQQITVQIGEVRNEEDAYTLAREVARIVRQSR